MYYLDIRKYVNVNVVDWNKEGRRKSVDILWNKSTGKKVHVDGGEDDNDGDDYVFGVFETFAIGFL